MKCQNSDITETTLGMMYDSGQREAAAIAKVMDEKTIQLRGIGIHKSDANKYLIESAKEFKLWAEFFMDLVGKETDYCVDGPGNG